MDNITINLTGYGFFRWSYYTSNSGGICSKLYTIGHAFLQNKLLNAEEVASLLSGCVEEQVNDIDRIKETIKRLNGNFSIIIDLGHIVIVASDKISSFPLFYSVSNGHGIITDDVRKIQNRKFDEGLAKEEFLASGFCSYKKTIYNNVLRVQAGEFVLIDNRLVISCSDYYIHKRNALYTGKTIQELNHEFDIVVKNVFARLLQYVNGRTIVVLLSGGYDSRLIITNLKKLNYKNVICTSFGNEAVKDFTVARNIAEKLGFKFIPIIVNKEFWAGKWKTGEIEKIFESSTAMASLSHFHLGSIAKYLIEAGLVPTDCVFITGQSGDAIEGNDITERFTDRDNVDIDEVVEAIVKRHYYFLGNKSFNSPSIKKEIRNWILSHGYLDKKYTECEAEDIYECFNWRERQSKYVVSDVRNYDNYLNCDWALPLWDDEFVQFWEKIEYSLYKKRNLYYKYIEEYLHEKLPSANVVSTQRKMINKIKNIFGGLLYPFYFLKALKDYFISNEFYFAPLGGVPIDIFFKTLLCGKGVRNSPFMYYANYLYYRVWNKMSK